MNIESMVFIWVGLGLLFTAALCGAAGRPAPKPRLLDRDQLPAVSMLKPA
jgi:hypothetical protein